MADSGQSVTQRIAMKALIVDDKGRVLILREARTYSEGTNISRYGLPGGRLDPGEPFMEGLAREVMEETGLEVLVDTPLFVGEWFPVIKGVQNQIVAVFFVCHAKTIDVRLNEEHDDYKWITPEEAESYDIKPPEDEVIRVYAERQAVKQ